MPTIKEMLDAAKNDASLPSDRTDDSELDGANTLDELHDNYKLYHIRRLVRDAGHYGGRANIALGLLYEAGGDVEQGKEYYNKVITDRNKWYVPDKKLQWKALKGIWSANRLLSLILQAVSVTCALLTTLLKSSMPLVYVLKIGALLSLVTGGMLGIYQISQQIKKNIDYKRDVGIIDKFSFECCITPVLFWVCLPYICYRLFCCCLTNGKWRDALKLCGVTSHEVTCLLPAFLLLTAGEAIGLFAPIGATAQIALTALCPAILALLQDSSESYYRSQMETAALLYHRHPLYDRTVSEEHAAGMMPGAADSNQESFRSKVANRFYA